MDYTGLRAAGTEPRSLIRPLIRRRPARMTPDDKVNREFTATAPNQFRVSDFTCVSTWMGMVHVAFVIESSPAGSSAGASRRR